MAVTYPREVRGLPVLIRAALKTECGGDWSRVTLDFDGSFIVHNQPQANGLSTNVSKPRAVRKPVVVKPEPPAVKPVPRPVPEPPRPAPVWTLKPSPVAKATVEPPIPQQVMSCPNPQKEGRFSTKAEALEMMGRLQRASFYDGEPLNVYSCVCGTWHVGHLKKRSSAIQDDFEEDQGADPKWDLIDPSPEPEEPILPGVFTEYDWQVDFTSKLFELMTRVKFGVGFKCPLRVSSDVTALHGVDVKQVIAVARRCDRVEVDASSATRKYPVLRMYVGDTISVVGFRQTVAPRIIAAYFRNQDLGSAKEKGVGGGGSRKQSGLPGSPSALLARIRNIGVEVPPDIHLMVSTFEVIYKGQSLGTISLKPGPKSDFGNAWQRIQRRVNAIDRPRS